MIRSLIWLVGLGAFCGEFVWAAAWSPEEAELCQSRCGTSDVGVTGADSRCPFGYNVECGKVEVSENRVAKHALKCCAKTGEDLTGNGLLDGNCRNLCQQNAGGKSGGLRKIRAIRAESPSLDTPCGFGWKDCGGFSISPAGSPGCRTHVKCCGEN